MEERRDTPRVPFRRAVQYFLSDRSAAGTLAQSRGCLGCNLSRGGMRFYAEDFLPSSAAIRLTLPLRTETPLTLEGRVAWAQKIPHASNYVVGVRFDDSSSNTLAQEQIERYVKMYSICCAHKSPERESGRFHLKGEG